jgi:hypothetical protein
MAILIPSEASTYLPDLTLGAAQLRLALTTAEAIAIGPSGSGRALDLRQHTEQLSVNDSGLAWLRQWPINTAQPVTLELRGFAQPGSIGVDEWVVSAADQFSLSDSGEVRIKLENSEFSYPSNFGRRRTIGVRRPMQEARRVEAKITYWSGFDFRMTIPADWETMAAGPERDRIEQVVTLKSALAGVVSLRQAAADALAGVGSSTGASANAEAPGRISKIDVDAEYGITYASDADAARLSDSAQKATTSAIASGSAMEELLAIFRQYRARQMPV